MFRASTGAESERGIVMSTPSFRHCRLTRPVTTSPATKYKLFRRYSSYLFPSKIDNRCHRQESVMTNFAPRILIAISEVRASTGLEVSELDNMGYDNVSLIFRHKPIVVNVAL